MLIDPEKHPANILRTPPSENKDRAVWLIVPYLSFFKSPLEEGGELEIKRTKKIFTDRSGIRRLFGKFENKITQRLPPLESLTLHASLHNVERMSWYRGNNSSN